MDVSLDLRLGCTMSLCFAETQGSGTSRYGHTSSLGHSHEEVHLRKTIDISSSHSRPLQHLAQETLEQLLRRSKIKYSAERHHTSSLGFERSKVPMPPLLPP
ncbi:hypothetical protein ACRALDRAFT_209535 [Sodiomyces alcalophilus JCM 7366]|uniref:uncharacterized protein n=1 Tax=Sodiomyces alcalophilus JCM 7366 TaxID=591952 RepID=UPI0039B4936E